MLKYYRLILICLLVIGVLLRFYNLNWGSPYYFHPDERNIASSVSQLNFPSQMNPNFFAYGSLPIYAIYFVGVIRNVVSGIPTPLLVSFETAVIVSRLFSAFFSTGLTILIFLIGGRLLNNKLGLFLAFLGVTSVGFIQYAHFGTYEMWLTFFTTLLFYVLIKEKLTKKKIILSGIILGILCSVKISSIILLPLPLLALALLRKQTITTKHYLFDTFLNFLLLITSAVLIFIFTNPFALLDYSSFMSSIQYESSVALGTLPVFYTQSFIGTIPILYHFLHVFPFLLNPLQTILFVFSFFYLTYLIFKTKNKPYMILYIFYLILFLSQAFFFVKWTRYMVPVVPFIYIIFGISFFQLIKILSPLCQRLCWCLVIILYSVYALSFFITTYTKQDSRIIAYEFAKKKIVSNAKILTTTYDIGILPFNQTFTDITLYNFYDMHIASETVPNNDYVVLPSQRIYLNRERLSNVYPKSAAYFKNLFSRKNYKIIYQTPCDIFCKIVYMGNPVNTYEETANVFDRPVVTIFKKL